jgi:membrane glycosyltransferase
LHVLGRIQLWLAILMYLSGPAWILFSLVGFGHAILNFGVDPLGSPALGAPAAWEGWALLAATMTIVFAPKLAGVAQVLLSAWLRRAYGGGARVLLSAVAEFLFSFVLAPIVAVAQTAFVLGMATGRTIRWEAQLRDSRSLPWSEALRGLWPQTLLGMSLGLAVLLLAPPASWAWAALFCGPLLLAVPFAATTSWTSWGDWLARHGIAATPEEIRPPSVVLAAGHAPRAPRTPMPASMALGGALVEAPAAPPVD